MYIHTCKLYIRSHGEIESWWTFFNTSNNWCTVKIRCFAEVEKIWCAVVLEPKAWAGCISPSTFLKIVTQVTVIYSHFGLAHRCAMVCALLPSPVQPQSYLSIYMTCTYTAQNSYCMLLYFAMYSIYVIDCRKAWESSDTRPQPNPVFLDVFGYPSSSATALRQALALQSPFWRWITWPWRWVN